MQNLVDTRVLNKTLKYIGVFIGILSIGIATLIGLIELSFYLFGSPVPLLGLIGIVSALMAIYQYAKDRVEFERREEQRLVDSLIRDAERAEENRKIEEKYGIKLT